MEHKRLKDTSIVFEEESTLVNQRYFDNPAFEEENQFYEDDSSEIEDQPLISKKHNNEGKNMMILDGVLFIIEYLQYFALLQSLSLRWTWPDAWTRPFAFLFLFNLDVWEMSKMYTENVYLPAKDSFVASSDVPVNYRVMLLCWLIALIIVTFTFFVLKWVFTHRLNYEALNKLMTSFVIIVQILALPIGIQIGKLFWCRPTDDTWDVDNSVKCWSAEHSIYVVFGLIVAIVTFIVYTAWLTQLINRQLITSNARKHEMYLRLKHCEHLYGLDNSWNEHLFFTFASFRRFWVFHRPFNHLLKLLILCFYAGLFTPRLVQISLIFGFFLVYMIFCLIRFPYRVSSFNFPHVWNFACLASASVIGVMKNIDGIQNVFLLPDYIWGELILINAGWLLGMCMWFGYCLLRANGCFCPSSQLFPTLVKRGRSTFTENTERYIAACVNGKLAIKKATEVPALLAPVQDLAYHIKVLNALACEAEYIRDPLHSTLRDVLDDVIQLHNKLSPVSIFSESLKAYVQTTITKLMQVLPAFSRRMHQREFDLILVNPVKRRILLKMFAVACFIRAGREERAHEPGVRKLWTAPRVKDSTLDEGFHDDEDSVIALNNIEITTQKERSIQSGRSSFARSDTTPPIMESKEFIDESFA